MILEERMEKIWEQLLELDHYKKGGYPFDQTPGIYEDEHNKKVKVILGSYKLKLVQYESGEESSVHPVIYQSCMDPQQIHICTLEVTKEGKTALYVKNHYEEWHIDLEKTKIEIQSWQPIFSKTNCRKCVNCGRCSW